MRALAGISSDLFGCVEGAPLPLMICKYVVAPMVACRVSVGWFAWEVMLFSPKARQCGTLQALPDNDGLTRKPISNCTVYVVIIVLKGRLGSVVVSRIAVSWLDGCRCIWWACHVK
jgi:hypothetical protein